MDESGLGKYAKAFIDSEVDMEILPELTESDLEKFEISLGPRKKILKAISALITQETSATNNRSAFPTAAAEQRQLMVMFCDLVGSTSLSESFNPKVLSELIRTFQGCSEKVIRKYDGTIARYLGDGILVYFGYPHAHEDNAERAIRAGLEALDSEFKLKVLGVLIETFRKQGGLMPILSFDKPTHRSLLDGKKYNNYRIVFTQAGPQAAKAINLRRALLSTI